MTVYLGEHNAIWPYGIASSAIRSIVALAALLMYWATRL